MLDEKQILSLLLPEEIIEWFEITNIDEYQKKLCIHLEEKNLAPQGNLESKGFYPEKEIQDFPLRKRMVYLIVKVRRWRDKDTKQEIKRDFVLTAKNSKYTKEFADFLKRIGLKRNPLELAK